MVVLLVLFTIILFLTIDWLVQRAQERRHILKTPAAVAAHGVALHHSGSRRVSSHELDKVPGGIFLSPGHVWVQVEPSGTVRVGMDRLLLSLLGDVECLYALPEGSEVRAGGPLAMVRSGQRALKIRSPLDGVVTEVNHRARRAPGKIGADPYDSGWFYRISPIRLSNSLKKMVLAEEAGNWMRREISRLRDLLTRSRKSDGPALVTLVDGGEPDVQPTMLGDEDWEKLIETYFACESGECASSDNADPQ